jgi:hypothetical protein
VSTHREIEEVYLSDIIKIQKSTKSIVAEELGELQGQNRRRKKKKSTKSKKSFTDITTVT